MVDFGEITSDIVAKDADKYNPHARCKVCSEDIHGRHGGAKLCYLHSEESKVRFIMKKLKSSNRTFIALLGEAYNTCPEHGAKILAKDLAKRIVDNSRRKDKLRQEKHRQDSKTLLRVASNNRHRLGNRLGGAYFF